MKTIFTPRDELVCGKLDKIQDALIRLKQVELIHLVESIRHDCERMESKLVERKLEVKNLKHPNGIDLNSKTKTV